VAKVLKCFQLLKLGRVVDWPLVPSATEDFACASVLRTTTLHPSTQQPITVGYLLRVEMNEQARAARCSVRAAHATVASAVLAMLVEQLERLFL